jgi:hypothetical protein
MIYLIVNMLKLLLIIIFIININGDIYDKVLLSSISSLTFYPNTLTSFKKTRPIQQMNCKSMNCNVKLLSITCTNLGIINNDVVWNCVANGLNGYKLIHSTVSCEGYDYPTDPYIVKGSCKVSYDIDRMYTFKRYTTVIIMIVIFIATICCCKHDKRENYIPLHTNEILYSRSRAPCNSHNQIINETYYQQLPVCQEQEDVILPQKNKLISIDLTNFLVSYASRSYNKTSVDITIIDECFRYMLIDPLEREISKLDRNYSIHLSCQSFMFEKDRETYMKQYPQCRRYNSTELFAFIIYTLLQKAITNKKSSLKLDSIKLFIVNQHTTALKSSYKWKRSMDDRATFLYPKLISDLYPNQFDVVIISNDKFRDMKKHSKLLFEMSFFNSSILIKKCLTKTNINFNNANKEQHIKLYKRIKSGVTITVTSDITTMKSYYFEHKKYRMDSDRKKIVFKKVFYQKKSRQARRFPLVRKT